MLVSVSSIQISVHVSAEWSGQSGHAPNKWYPVQIPLMECHPVDDGGHWSPAPAAVKWQEWPLSTYLLSCQLHTGDTLLSRSNGELDWNGRLLLLLMKIDTNNHETIQASETNGGLDLIEVTEAAQRKRFQSSPAQRREIKDVPIRRLLRRKFGIASQVVILYS